MNEFQLQHPHHGPARTILRVGGAILVALGLLFIIVGVTSFFMAMTSFEPPRFFWCAFVGMPLLFVGSVMCMFGFLGAFQRYFIGETAPVAKDAANYMGINTQPGVSAVASAITQGVLEAQSAHQAKEKDA